MKEEISELIQRRLNDTKIGFATVTEVELTNDLRYARVFVSVYGEGKDNSQTLEGLRKASGFIRSELARRIRLRHFPELEFLWDSSIEQGARMSKLLEDINCERKNS